MSARVSLHLAFVLLAGLLGGFFFAGPAVALPDGFTDGKVADVPAPVALDFTPNGRMLVASQPGQIYIVADGQTSRALDLRRRVCSNSNERGLLGVAVDPDFGDPGHKYVYLYYTYGESEQCEPGSTSDPVNRVSRFTMSGNKLDLGSEKILINNILSPAGNHNGGDLKFGKNKLLYVSVGDGGCDYADDSGCGGQNDASRDRNVLLGKILRIRRDGGIPTSNPYTGQNSTRCNLDGRTAEGNNCKETFAVGLRNPFRMAFNPDATGTSFRINDVGQRAREEIDRGQAGADYGWNLCEGSEVNPELDDVTADCIGGDYTGPIHEYSHSTTGCRSITGGAFVPDGFWPAPYDRAYLFGDFICNTIFKLTPEAGGGFEREVFADELGAGGPISMAFGPYGASGRALYYTTFSDGGQVRRIAHNAGNIATVEDADTADANYGLR